MLIALYTHKDNQNITSFKTLQYPLPIEKSHISQSLAHNEENGLIQKPKKANYFTQIQITPEGIQKAKRQILNGPSQNL